MNWAFSYATRHRSVASKPSSHQYAIISPTTHCASERASAQTKAGALDVGDARLHTGTCISRGSTAGCSGNEHAIDSLPRIQYYTIGTKRVADSPTAGRSRA